ncbi:MAG: YdeI/OmpD-associated family protein [Bacteroidetes bacterium]|nr:YdeI/OmpD-associated family protein [Bacteroidota bacterium]
MRCKLGGTPACKVHKWAEELQLLRCLALQSGLKEECKWGMPVYTTETKPGVYKNVVLLAAFKDYASLNFFKGALLEDPAQILDKAGENSREARLFKTTDPDRILRYQQEILACLQEAAAVEKSGKKLPEEPKKEMNYPSELEAAFHDNPEFRAAFEALTPGRQRGYMIHFSGAKQAQTREARIAKYYDAILKGKGMLD